MRIEKILWLIIFILIIGCQSNLDKLKSERNLLRGLKLAQKLDKPIFLHFTGYGCVADNEFHNGLIQSNKIFKKLNKDFVTIELFVDDKREFKDSDTLNLHKLGFSDEGRKKIKKAKSIGNINATIQIDWLKNNTQPLYLIIDSKRNILVEPFGYISRNRELFLAKLNKGIDNFRKRKSK